MNKNNKNSSLKPSQVMGLRIDGNQLSTELVQVDSKFEKCPIAHAAGIPLYVKRLSHLPRKVSSNYLICRMMSKPQIGIAALDWQYGGCLQPAPSVLVARSDLIAFDINDWWVLDQFQMQMLDDGPRNVTRDDFIRFVQGWKNQSSGRRDIYNANIVLEVLYPKGSRCRVDGIVSKKQLNGLVGIFNGQYENQRVGITFPQLQKNYAIKPINIIKF